MPQNEINQTESRVSYSLVRAESFGRVAVLMGGDSAERDISLKSGRAALEALKRKGVDAFGLDLRFQERRFQEKHVTKNSFQEKPVKQMGSICQQINAEKFDTAFIALHGRGGEDGVIQGVLEAQGIPYSGCGVAASAIAMDKLRTKMLWSGGGLPTPSYELVKAADIVKDEVVKEKVLSEKIEQIAEKLGFPVMVKPAHEGSSIGMNKADNQETLQYALLTAAKYDNEILVEQWVVGKEYTGAVLDGQVLPLIRLDTPRDFYDYQAKYVSDDTIYHCPCGLDKETETQYQLLILEAFNQVGGQGWGRVDFMCDEQGNPWLIEVNTVPGLTDHSLVPMAARNNGIEFDDLIYRILQTAISYGNN